MIEIDRKEDGILAIRIDGESLDSDDGETWFLPKGLIGEIAVNDLPDNTVFEICKRIEDSVVILDTIPIRLQKIGNNRVRLDFHDSGTRKHWDGTIGFKAYMEAKQAIVEEREMEIGDVSFYSYDDDSTWIHLDYSAEFETDKLLTAVELLARACRKAGVRDFHFHDFRHCVATRWATRDKIAPAVAMRALGWNSPQMLIRYVNLQEGAVGEAFGTSRRFEQG